MSLDHLVMQWKNDPSVKAAFYGFGPVCASLTERYADSGVFHMAVTFDRPSFRMFCGLPAGSVEDALNAGISTFVIAAQIVNIEHILSRFLPEMKRHDLRLYDRNGIDLAESADQYVFTNRSGDKLSRSGVKYILDKYVEEGRKENPTLFPEKISPHTLRHTKAMHMLQAGNNIVYIRDILGHSDLNTTERYARADTAMKREALAKAEIPMPDPVSSLPETAPDTVRCTIEDDMANWLKNLNKK